MRGAEKPVEDKKAYEKPKIEKVEVMVFPLDILGADRVVCKQCSSCHGCR